jgi:hypothetical protein
MDTYSSPGSSPGKSRSSLKPVLWVGLACFSLGAAAAAYVAWRYEPSLFGLSGSSASSAVLPNVTPSGMASVRPGPTPSPSSVVVGAAVERVVEQQGGIEQRLAAAEQRLARLDLQAQAATGNVARAEGLLIAFAARRSLSRGDDIGYLADQLRLRFGDALPNAVDTVIAFARQPVTLDQLVARLDGIAPTLADPTERSLLDRVQREVGGLFVVRRESTPSPQPAQRLERARYFLESGRVDDAIREVRGLPGANNADAWIRDAQRYDAAHRALDLIEKSAVLEPRRLRDSAGTPIEQPGPAD